MPNPAILAAQARKNMVDSQIHTAGVISEEVLHAFRTVPRELFVPEHLRGVAYIDEDLPLGDGRYLMEPAVLARMIQAAEVKPGDVVLNIGDDTGYSSAILSMLAGTVITVEAQPGLLEGARVCWAEFSYCNVAVINGDLTEGCVEHAPYSLIFMKGAVAEIPDIFLAQLSLHGRLLAILRPAGAKIGTAVIIERIGDGKYSTRKLFDAATPYIPGFEPRTEFAF
jgi:protein-L-isoaspartate(D-aspartate) O-methyltransferase